MRTIAITKPCSEYERKIVLSSLEKDDKVLFFADEQELLVSEELENVDIVFGEPELSTISSMKNLRWIQMTWAGANKYTSSTELFEHTILTSASGAYGSVISEYIISGILALYRNLFLYQTQMEKGYWNRIEKEDTLEGKRALILGTGNIGQETAKRLKCFGACTVGMSRTNKDKQLYFDELYTIENLDMQLQSADIVIIALPGTPETRGMFDAERINRMKPDAMLVNVGRGFVVNTDALTDALQKGMLKGAVLDVTDPEPLPEKHPLRSMEHVVLTPHISGISWGENKFTRKRILDIFCENMKQDSNGELLRNIIDFSKGY